MEEAPANGKELLHFAHADGMNEFIHLNKCWTKVTTPCNTLDIVSRHHATNYFAHRSAPTTTHNFSADRYTHWYIASAQYLQCVYYLTLYALQSYVNRTGSCKARVFMYLYFFNLI
jgi:hypothetical protein